MRPNARETAAKSGLVADRPGRRNPRIFPVDEPVSRCSRPGGAAPAAACTANAHAMHSMSCRDPPLAPPRTRRAPAGKQFRAIASQGARRFFTFRLVTLPLILPGSGAGMFLAFMASTCAAAISGLMAMVTLVLLVLVDRLVRVDRQRR